MEGGGGGQVTPIFLLLHISFSLVEISLHVEFHPIRRMGWWEESFSQTEAIEKADISAKVEDFKEALENHVKGYDDLKVAQF
jgi:hypothetical protein